MRLNLATVNGRAVNGAAYLHPRIAPGDVEAVVHVGADGPVAPLCIRQGFGAATISLPAAASGTQVTRVTDDAPGLLTLSASLTHAPVTKQGEGAATFETQAALNQTVARVGDGQAELGYVEAALYFAKSIQFAGDAALSVRLSDTLGIQRGATNLLIGMAATLDAARVRATGDGTISLSLGSALSGSITHRNFGTADKALSLGAGLDPSEVVDPSHSAWRSGAVNGRTLGMGLLNNGPRAQRYIWLTGADLTAATLSTHLDAYRRIADMGALAMPLIASGTGVRVRRVTESNTAETTISVQLDRQQVKPFSGDLTVSMHAAIGPEVMVEATGTAVIELSSPTLSPTAQRYGAFDQAVIAPFDAQASDIVRTQIGDGTVTLEPVTPAMTGIRGAGGRGTLTLDGVMATSPYQQVERRTTGLAPAPVLRGEFQATSLRRMQSSAALALLESEWLAACVRFAVFDATTIDLAHDGAWDVVVQGQGSEHLATLQASGVGQVTKHIGGTIDAMALLDALPAQGSAIRRATAVATAAPTIEVKNTGEVGAAGDGAAVLFGTYPAGTGQVARHIEGEAGPIAVSVSGAGDIHVRAEGGAVAPVVTAEGEGLIYVRGEGAARPIAVSVSGAGDIHVRAEGTIEPSALAVEGEGLIYVRGEGAARPIEIQPRLTGQVAAPGDGEAAILLFAPDATGYMNPAADDNDAQVFYREESGTFYYRSAA